MTKYRLKTIAQIVGIIAGFGFAIWVLVVVGISIAESANQDRTTARDVVLPDGSSVTCVFDKNRAITCDWSTRG